MTGASLRDRAGRASPEPASSLGQSATITGAVPSLKYPTSWPRPATPCDLVPLWAGEFKSHADWVNFASKRLVGCRGSVGEEVKAICVDALGRRCNCGADMARARDEDAFPVRYFWECQPAQGIDARSGETGTGSTEGESPVPEACAQTPPSKDINIGEGK